MTNDPFVAEPFGPVANLGRRLREIFGEAYGDLDERTIELLHELDFIPWSREPMARPLVADRG